MSKYWFHFCIMIIIIITTCWLMTFNLWRALDCMSRLEWYLKSDFPSSPTWTIPGVFSCCQSRILSPPAGCYEAMLRKLHVRPEITPKYTWRGYRNRWDNNLNGINEKSPSSFLAWTLSWLESSAVQATPDKHVGLCRYELWWADREVLLCWLLTQ